MGCLSASAWCLDVWLKHSFHDFLQTLHIAVRRTQDAL